MFFGEQGVVLEAHDLADLVEELEFWIGDEAFGSQRRIWLSNIPPHDKVRAC